MGTSRDGGPHRIGLKQRNLYRGLASRSKSRFSRLRQAQFRPGCGRRASSCAAPRDWFMTSLMGFQANGSGRIAGQIVGIMRAATRAEPTMWGINIVGFGHYSYIYANGKHPARMVTGVSPRKKKFTLSIMDGFEGHGELSPDWARSPAERPACTSGGFLTYTFPRSGSWCRPQFGIDSDTFRSQRLRRQKLNDGLMRASAKPDRRPAKQPPHTCLGTGCLPRKRV